MTNFKYNHSSLSGNLPHPSWPNETSVLHVPLECGKLASWQVRCLSHLIREGKIEQVCFELLLRVATNSEGIFNCHIKTEEETIEIVLFIIIIFFSFYAFYYSMQIILIFDFVS